MKEIPLRDRVAVSLANFVLVRVATMELLAYLYEVNRLGTVEYKKRRKDSD